MKKLFKRLWAFFFSTKNSATDEPQKDITERAIELLQEQRGKDHTNGPVSIDLSEKKKLSVFKKKVHQVSMKNNRLHIQYNGDSGLNGHNVVLRKWSNGMCSWIMGKMYKGRIDSMRCTQLKRAEEIVRQTQRYCIELAIFKDSAGNEFRLI